jgi:hypothetical protein
MNERATKLFDDADRQISELKALIAAAGQCSLTLPCPGREKLGDGSVAAAAMHAADNYQRIAQFAGGGAGGGGHRPPKFLRGRHGPGQHAGGIDYRADRITMKALLDQLTSGRKAIARLGGLTDQQLDVIPAASELRFVDGQRTLEQILTAMLKHQAHQADAISEAVKAVRPARTGNTCGRVARRPDDASSVGAVGRGSRLGL